MSGLVEMPWVLEWDGEDVTLFFGFDPGSKRIRQVHVGPQTLYCADLLNELVAAVVVLARVQGIGLHRVRALYEELGAAHGFALRLLDAWEAAEAKMRRALDERQRGAGHG